MQNMAYSADPNIMPIPPALAAQAAPAPSVVVVVNDLDGSFGPESQTVFCRLCSKQVQTDVQYEIGVFTIVLALFFGLFVCCCNCSKDAIHLCPHCHTLLGRYKRGCS